MANPNADAHVWLPYTQMMTAPTPLEAAATTGTHIRLADGRELIDGVASWWTACHGYNHPHITAMMRAQLEQMPHIMFGGIVHDQALRLAARLAKITPGDLDNVFFSDSGSVAVDVALKIAVQYWLNKSVVGRTKFIHFRDGYHGDTMACMSVCDPDESMHSHFKGWLPENFCADLPRDDLTTKQLDQLMNRERDQLAAVIVEPLVQGVGGMKFHDPATLKRLADLAAKHGLLLIADEIFTGFGRTGTMFACEQAGIVPDIMCLGKALSGGAITLAATLARKHVFETFWSKDSSAALMHGPTYMANALACAGANASLDLFETEPRLEQIRAIEKQMLAELEPCRGMQGVADVRVKGAIGIVEMHKIDDMQEWRQEFIRRGTWIRAYGNIIYLTPAFTIDTKDLTKLTSAIVGVVGNDGKRAVA